MMKPSKRCESGLKKAEGKEESDNGGLGVGSWEFRVVDGLIGSEDISFSSANSERAETDASGRGVIEVVERGNNAMARATDVTKSTHSKLPTPIQRYSFFMCNLVPRYQNVFWQDFFIKLVKKNGRNYEERKIPIIFSSTSFIFCSLSEPILYKIIERSAVNNLFGRIMLFC